MEPKYQIVSRRTHVPQASPVMEHEQGPEGISKDVITLSKYFFEISEMVKFFYEGRCSRLQGES